MLKEIIKDENYYKNGLRVNTQVILTTFSKSDDIILLSQDYQTLGRLEATIEQLEKRVLDEKDVNVHQGLRNEIIRMKNDREIMMEKIKLQQGYIDEYDNEVEGITPDGD